MREVDGGNGYAGQSSTRVHVGLGRLSRVDAVEIRWPDGHVQAVQPPIDRVTTVTEPAGARR